MKTRKYVFGLVVMFFMISLSSCAPEGYTSSEAGFFSGLWHGIIIMFSLIGKLIGADVGIYAEHNTGLTYWLGFIIGIGAFGGGGSAARR